jgi:hypothetical protein
MTRMPALHDFLTGSSPKPPSLPPWQRIAVVLGLIIVSWAVVAGIARAIYSQASGS